MMKMKRETNLIREIPIASTRVLNEDNREVELSFSSEAPYKRYWGMEILDHSDGAVDLTRLNEIGVLLFNHDTDKVIGKVLTASVEDNRGVAVVRFDKDELSEMVYQKVLNSTLQATSVGYVVDDWEEVKENATSSDGRFKGKVSIAKHWTALEISIVSVPADPNVGVGRSIEAEVDDLSNYKYRLSLNNNILRRKRG